eukprot:9264077-Alexandrium_andersonii.AAC.1
MGRVTCATFGSSLPTAKGAYVKVQLFCTIQHGLGGGERHLQPMTKPKLCSPKCLELPKAEGCNPHQTT